MKSWMKRISMFLSMLFMASCSNVPKPTINVQAIPRVPVIDPDYQQVTIPPNIAPLNFRICEAGSHFMVLLQNDRQAKLQLTSADGLIKIPPRKWRRLLEASAGSSITVTITTIGNDGVTQSFSSFPIHVAPEKIDDYLVYRLIHPAHLLWRKMGIYQRNLTRFQEKPILQNSETNNECMNCHHFNNFNPNMMMLHLRGAKTGGTLLIQDHRVEVVNTATKANRAGAYPAWSPDGKRIAFSVNNLEMFFHALGEPRDVLDRGSDILIYDIDQHAITAPRPLADPQAMETFPCWSPDGRSLYFCSCPPFDQFINENGLDFKSVRYDLKKADYDPITLSWRDAEMILSAEETGKSITEPMVSPDGRFLLFCMADFGHFAIYNQSSDIYIMDLQSRRYSRFEYNSDAADTFPGWSSNSRWIVYSSKQRDNIAAQPCFAYVDAQGRFYKPFLLPQKNPVFYDAFTSTYNRPVLIKSRVTVRSQKLAAAAFARTKIINATRDAQQPSLTGDPQQTTPYHPAPN